MIVVAAVACLAAYLAVAGPAALGFGLISQALFMAPGLLILRAIAKTAHDCVDGRGLITLWLIL